jgi:hypothetical protein
MNTLSPNRSAFPEDWESAGSSQGGVAQGRHAVAKI